MINKPFFQFLLTSRKLVSKRMHTMCIFFLIVCKQFWKKNTQNTQRDLQIDGIFKNRRLNDFLCLKDKKLKRCPSCNVLPFSLDRLGQDFSCRLRTHCGCFCTSWVSLLFCFFLPHIAKLSGNISFKETWFLQLHIPTKQKRLIFAKMNTLSNNFLS